MDHGLVGLAASGVLAAHFEGQHERIQQVISRLFERRGVRILRGRGIQGDRGLAVETSPPVAASTMLAASSLGSRGYLMLERLGML
jgi:hypothetical protein